MDRLSVAPMMDWTDRHYRFMARLLTKHTKLYTEMLVDSTLMHSRHAAGYLRFHPVEHPIACQLGGSNPKTLAVAAKMVEDAGYDEINLNCGCPSPKVSLRGCFGARLMFSPELVRDCVAAMKAVVKIPVTVKCRLGADPGRPAMKKSERPRVPKHLQSRGAEESECDGGCGAGGNGAEEGASDSDNESDASDSAREAAARIPIDPEPMLTYEQFADFIRIVAQGGCEHFIVHARHCVLKGLDTKGNRTVPRLHYEWVQRAALQFPHLHFSINGGIQNLDQAQQLLALRRDPANGVTTAAADAAAQAAAMAAAAANPKLVQPPEYPMSKEEWHALPDKVRGYMSYKLHRAKAAAAALAALAAGTPAVPVAAADDAAPKGTTGLAHDAMTGRLPASQFYESVYHGEAAPGSFGIPGDSVLDSVMIGRAAYNNPWHTLGDADRKIFGVPNPGITRRELIAQYLEYADTVVDTVPADERDMWLYCKPFELAKPLIGLFQGEYGGGRYRTTLATLITEHGKTLRESLAAALEFIPDEVLDERQL